MQVEALRDLVVKALDDMKARDVVVIDVRGKTSITDLMVIASGTSDRHVKAVAEAVAFQAKLAGERPLGTEGVEQGEWALIDLNGVVVHVMLPKVRDFYQIERLWSVDEPPSAAREPAARDGA
jgi:ribosome-associated protein